jgi:hypothetical protein
MLWCLVGHEYTREVTRCPLGIGGVVIGAYDGAEDDVWPRGDHLLLELFVLSEVLLSRQARLSFAREF